MPRHRPAATALLDHPDDYGHAFVRRNARLTPTRIGASANMELADIVDIEHPDKRGATVRVARRIDPLIAILDVTREGPGRAQWLAAEEFRRHNAIANGVRPMAWMSYIAAAAGDGQTPAQLLLDAQRSVRQAWLAIRGPENNAMVADIVRLVVLGHVTLQVVDMSRRCRHGTSRDILDVGLTRLTDHYGMA